MLGSTFGPYGLRYCKRANSARLPLKLKIRSSKTSVLCETSSKTEDPELQNERFVRDFFEKLKIRSSKTSILCETSSKTQDSGLPKRAFCARHLRKLKIRSSKTSVLRETSSKIGDPELQNERCVRDFHEN